MSKKYKTKLGFIYPKKYNCKWFLHNKKSIGIFLQNTIFFPTSDIIDAFKLIATTCFKIFNIKKKQILRILKQQDKNILISFLQM